MCGLIHPYISHYIKYKINDQNVSKINKLNQCGITKSPQWYQHISLNESDSISIIFTYKVSKSDKYKCSNLCLYNNNKYRDK